MTKDASFELQRALYQRLSTALTDICEVYDYVPRETDFPYAILRDETITDNGDKDGPGQEFVVSVHVWDRATGDKASSQDAKNILAAVYDSLHEQSFSVSGQAMFLCRFDHAAGVDLDQDGLSWHGIHRYRIRTQPTS